MIFWIWWSSYPSTFALKFCDFEHFRRFSTNFYIFIIDGLEPKLFDFKSSSQQQSCKAHKIGQLCHQDQPSTCLCSKVRDRATTAFPPAPKWQKGANAGFCKFGSFQPYLTHRHLDCITMMFIESHFHGYPTCLIFAQMVLVVGGTVNSKNNKNEKTREYTDMRMYHFSWNFL